VTDRPARSQRIDINPVADGYVVYDRAGDMVHYLNHTASMVLELCNGEDTVAEIAELLADVFADESNVEDAVASCVYQLRGIGLLRAADPEPSPAPHSTPI
jgi:hypothetical protein